MLPGGGAFCKEKGADGRMQPRSWKGDLGPYLPPRVREMLASVDEDAPLEEIRLRAGQPLQLCFTGCERLIYAVGGRPAVSAQDCADTLSRVCEQSLYAWEEELKSGFVTLPGGYRVGVCGRAVGHDGVPARLTDVTSLNFRIGGAVEGAALPVLPLLADGAGLPRSTLVLSAPGCGKTTLLRDLARLCATGAAGVRPCRVGVVDTRFELAGSLRGVPQFDLGPRTDVLSGCTKAVGMRLLVTAMSPEVLVADELSTAADVEAAQEAAACGVRLLAGVHAGEPQTLLARPPLRELLRARLFDRYVLLGRSRGVGTVEGVFDGELRQLAAEAAPCCGRSL